MKAGPHAVRVHGPFVEGAGSMRACPAMLICRRSTSKKPSDVNLTGSAVVASSSGT